MRTLLATSSFVSLAGLLPLAVAHCGSGAAPAKPDGGGDGDASTSFTYQPLGCGYAVTPPDSRGYTGFALDDTTAPSDAAGAAPVRVRIGLGGGTTMGAAGYADPTTTAAFTWETAAKTTNAKVRLGTDGATFADVHAGYSWTSPPPQVGFGSNEPEAYMHEVHVCGLTAGKTYYYQVGGGAAGQEVWGATQTFTTLPAAGGGKITLGVFGDSRDSKETWQLVHERMKDATLGIDMLLVSGDIVDFGTQESLYSNWLDAIWHDPTDAKRFLTLGEVMMIPIAGNHENDAAQFYANFALPGDGAFAEQYASFNVGNAHVALIDDEPIASAPSGAAAAAILAWADADLKAANADRAAHPFIVVISHRGLFSTSNHADDSDVHQARGSLVPLFDKYKVDLVFNGHDHEYERSKPVRAGSPASGPPVVGATVADGTVYIINAGAGADPYKVGTYASDYRSGNPTQFGTGTPFVGCYATLTLEGAKMTVNAYGLKVAGGGVAGDMLLDTYVFGQ